MATLMVTGSGSPRAAQQQPQGLVRRPPGRLRRHALSGFFARLAPESLGIGAGCHGLDPQRLTRFRQAVTDPASGMELAGIAERLEAAGYELGGATLKRPPGGFPSDGPPGVSCSTRPCSSTRTNLSTSASTARQS
jgi:Conserved hypothetical protein (DUF2461)